MLSWEMQEPEIPSFFAPATAGEEILKMLSSHPSAKLKADIVNGIPASVWHSTLATSTVSLFAISAAAATYIISRRFRALLAPGAALQNTIGTTTTTIAAADDEDADRSPPLNPDDVRKLPTETYDASSRTAGGSVCSVCLEEFEAGATLRVLPCSHKFHMRCIDQWLIEWKHSLCPLCKCRADAPRRQQKQHQSHDGSNSIEQEKQEGSTVGNSTTSAEENA